MIRPHRTHPGYWAFLLHRLSGLTLVLFLPVHLWVLGMAFDSATFDSAIEWTSRPLVKLGEWGIVVLLAAHLTGGVRLLILEFLPWSDRHKFRIAISVGLAALFGCAFALGLM